jgi:hypothetical protein
VINDITHPIYFNELKIWTRIKSSCKIISIHLGNFDETEKQLFIIQSHCAAHEIRSWHVYSNHKVKKTVSKRGL